MAGFEVIIYGRFWVITEVVFEVVQIGQTAVCRDLRMISIEDV
jgi:hypothetical protein